MINNKTKLSYLDKKYCRCLVKVRANSLKKSKNKETVINPYGICTNSVYLLKGEKRPRKINCSKNYDFNKLNYNQLKSYLIEKKIKVRNKGKYLSKKKLLSKTLKLNL